MKQSKIEVHHDKKLVVTVPMQEEMSSGSGLKRTSSPILIDLDGDMSTASSRKTRSSKRKAEDLASNEAKRQKKEKEKVKEKEKAKEKEKISKQKKQDDKPPVQLKKAEKSKKNGVNTANGSVPQPEKKKGMGGLTVDELLKLDGLHKL